MVQDGYGQGIFGQRYDATGLPLGRVPRQHLDDENRSPAVALADAGDFVVVWHRAQDGSNEASSGSATQPGEPWPRVPGQLLHPEHPAHPVGSHGRCGNFVVVWASFSQDGSANGVFAQRFDSSGAPLGVESRVNTYTIGGPEASSAGMDAAGDFVVVWNSDYQDGVRAGVFGQSSTPPARLGREFRVNTYTSSIRRSVGGDGRRR